jgi:excinuclease ABC subunit B
MQVLLDETERRRQKQMAYNALHGITPTTVHRQIAQSLHELTHSPVQTREYSQRDDAQGNLMLAADDDVRYWSKPKLEKGIAEVQKKMEKAAAELDFITAAKYRDEMFALKKLLKSRE